jgi:hypothetical protein
VKLPKTNRLKLIWSETMSDQIENVFLETCKLNFGRWIEKVEGCEPSPFFFHILPSSNPHFFFVLGQLPQKRPPPPLVHHLPVSVTKPLFRNILYFFFVFKTYPVHMIAIADFFLFWIQLSLLANYWWFTIKIFIKSNWNLFKIKSKLADK